MHWIYFWCVLNCTTRIIIENLFELKLVLKKSLDFIDGPIILVKGLINKYLLIAELKGAI